MEVCDICSVSVPSSGKAMKQHLKSRPHKLKMKGIPEGSEPRQERDRDDREDECALCTLLSRESEDTVHDVSQMAESPQARFCHAPPWIAAPKKSHVNGVQPFLTTRSGELPEIPKNFAHVVELYCNTGAIRFPNIDINHKRVHVSSWSHAKKSILDAVDDQLPMWVAFAVNDIAHPRWWPGMLMLKPSPLTFSEDNHVPTYDQVIVGRGATDIGLHCDRFCPPDSEPTNVDTYFTLARGKKYVVMLPPGQTIFDERAEFPLNPSANLLEAIVESGGFIFDLEPVDKHTPACVYIPMGWHHWLLGGSAWAVAYGGSRF
jgi:hypothetical protein